MSYVLVDVNKIRNFSIGMFCHHGLSFKDSETVTDVLLTADLFGIESHGVQRLIRYHNNLTKGQVVTKPNIEIVKETPVCATINANQCLGHISGTYAMNLAIKKAKKAESVWLPSAIPATSVSPAIIRAWHFRIT